MGDRQTLPVRYRLAYGEGLWENRNGLSPRNRGSTGILASIIGHGWDGTGQQLTICNPAIWSCHGEDLGGLEKRVQMHEWRVAKPGALHSWSFKGCSQIAGNLCTEVPVVLGRAVHNKDGVGVGAGVGAGVGVGVGVKNAPKLQSGIWGRPISLAVSESDSASPPAPD
ncbi:hypothetical protein O988_06573 [Pseudogymnoascus sp. VKM F-3808]|nr:hypothetical protein O988_06573 [Pseudogymnoascus sp. VKM F-3808]